MKIIGSSFKARLAPAQIDLVIWPIRAPGMLKDFPLILIVFFNAYFTGLYA